MYKSREWNLIYINKRKLEETKFKKHGLTSLPSTPVKDNLDKCTKQSTRAFRAFIDSTCRYYFDVSNQLFRFFKFQ